MAIRYKATIEYLGNGFCGWQRQKNAITVQEVLENALFKFTRQKIMVFAAGRTDSGVHALGQVIHFDLEAYIKPYKIINAVNHFVKPYPVVLLDMNICDIENFHARFSVIKKHYLYRIINRYSKLVQESDRAWWIKKTLDVNAMKKAADSIIGYHDFSSFRAAKCSAKSPHITLEKLNIEKIDSQEIRFYFVARSFLYHMVRNLVGSLVLVGLEKWDIEKMHKALVKCNRNMTGQTAPTCGLYLVRIEY